MSNRGHGDDTKVSRRWGCGGEAPTDQDVIREGIRFVAPLHFVFVALLVLGLLPSGPAICSGTGLLFLVALLDSRKEVCP